LGAATVTATMLAIAPASAHFCFKTNLNEHAKAGMLGSANWVAFEDLAAEVTGLCPEGVQILADAAGVSLDTPINGHGLMAGGTLKKGGGNPAISHLDFDAIDLAFPDAVAACRRRPVRCRPRSPQRRSSRPAERRRSRRPAS
jgi:hypothetical protein